ncbi:MAG: hypothetical protein JRG73_20525 [Deltaproteobacteria bacterium]|nr:hypothetical protein [Deltaproteobacteria bacterium]
MKARSRSVFRQVKGMGERSPGHFLIVGLVVFALLFVYCPQITQAQELDTKKEPVKLEEQWGVQVVSIRLMGADHFVNFRYRVIDPEKALETVSPGKKAYLIDQATGTKLFVPMTKVGRMRHKDVKALANRQYNILFSNSGKIVKKGSTVTVVIGDFRAENLTVQ